MSAPRLLAPTTISGGVPTAGSGTLNTIALWTPDGNTLGNSLLTQSGNIVTNASGAIRALGTTQTSPAFTRHDTTTSGIYFPATNEIGFTISNQHAMFISSGRLVGIGTVSPAGRLDVVGVAGLSWAIRAQVSSANTSPALNAELGYNLKNTSATVGNYTSITNRDSSDNANTQINFINVNNSGSGAINFVTRDSVGGSGERVRIDSAGNVILNSANTGATIQAAGTSQGLKLQGTGGTNNTDPNTLDCYADGGTANSGGVTWTPALRFGGATTGITGSQVGRYTRIGNMVFAQGTIALSSKGSATGAASIAGLPTSANVAATIYYSIAIGYNSKVTFTGQLHGLISVNSGIVELYQTSTTGVVSAITNTDFAADSVLTFTVCYPVT